MHLNNSNHINITANIITKNKTYLRQITVNSHLHWCTEYDILYAAIMKCVNLKVLYICGNTNDNLSTHINLLTPQLHTINITNVRIDASPILNNIAKYNNMIKHLLIDCNTVSIKSIENIIAFKLLTI